MENSNSEGASIPILQQNLQKFKSLHKISATDLLSYGGLCFPHSGMAKYFLEDAGFAT
jgi:arylamine N-acetyltransferase